MDGSIDIALEDIALCTNKSCHCLDVSKDDVVSFGSSNSVVLYQPHGWTNTRWHSVMTFNHHKGKVLCTKWMKILNNHNETKFNYLLSGSTDKSVIVWKYDNNIDQYFRSSSLNVEMVLEGHNDAITGIDGLFSEVLNLYFIVSTAADSTVKVWMGRELPSVKCNQTIDFQNGFILDVAMHPLPKSNIPLLACAADDHTVKLYICNFESPENCKFENAIDLKGHEDWVRAVDFINVDDDTLYLVSCSQDSFIRLWKLSLGYEPELDELKMKKHNFFVDSGNQEKQQYSVVIDAVLSGHENWVYSVKWHRRDDSEICLLSCSIDKTIVIWKYDKENEMWIDSIRVGEMGGNTLGFYGAQFDTTGKHLIAHSHTGALYGWRKCKDELWKSAVVVGGHTSPVNDIAWEPSYGRYLISAGEDQTTRLFGKWKLSKMWHEIARPQIHGYDMQCLGAIESSKFVSGADEKVLRVFNASKNFITNFEQLTGDTICHSNELISEGATVPALGLSNKAVQQKQEPVITNRREQYIENLFSPVELSQPPPESYLLQNTLWPEIRKVYGHVYEIFCVACSHSGDIVASAGKSSQPKHSAIMIWDVSKWEQACFLQGHTLTVTQMEFSPNDTYLLSVSRDRTWIVHKLVDPASFKFEKVAHSDKKTGHSRIIWSCSWSHDSKFFATASRDKKIKLWEIKNESTTSVLMIAAVDCKEPATAVAFASSSVIASSYELAVGLESGIIKLFRMTGDFSLIELIVLNKHFSHCLTVKRLKWRPFNESNETNRKCLASCAQDHQIKFFNVIY